MHDAFRIASTEIVTFLSAHLPKVSEDWWEKLVVARLSFHQQKAVLEYKLVSLEQMDLAALLRIVDHNWHDISQHVALPRDARNWLKELQSVRNRWAHASSEAFAPSDVYRDADTLERFLVVIGASQAAMASLRGVKQSALIQMTREAGEERRPTAQAPRRDEPAALFPKAVDDGSAAASAPNTTSQADMIRAFALKHYVQEARLAGASDFTIRAGDLHREMGLSNAVPAVCSALGSNKFALSGKVRIVERTGPKFSTTTCFHFRFNRDGYRGD